MKIIIVEDNFEIANSYRVELKKHNIIADIALTKEEGYKKIVANEYDLALLDINLPDGSGTDLLNEIRRAEIAIGIIMITARMEEELISDSLDQGADDYLQKPVRFNELVSRVNAVYRRIQTRNTSNKVVDNLTIDYSKNLILINDQIIKMTNKEFLIISKLAEVYPGYCPTERLNASLYDEYEITGAAIRVHIYNLKKKLTLYDINIVNTKNLGYQLCFPQ